MDDLLVGPDGALVRITALDDQTRVDTVYNLTVNRIHTYYTLAGDTNEPLLVHNCSRVFLHAEESLRATGSFSHWSKQPTESIKRSLKPGADELLVVNQRGTILDGNTRSLVLKDRGVNVDQLPAVLQRSGDLPDAFG